MIGKDKHKARMEPENDYLFNLCAYQFIYLFVY